MSFKNDVGALFNEATGQQKWYVNLGLTRFYAAGLRSNNKKGEISTKLQVSILEGLGYKFIVTKGSDTKGGHYVKLEDNINTIFSEVASQRMWHEQLEMNPRQAAITKFHFSVDKLSLDAQIEMLEKLGYSIHIIKTAPK